MIKLDEIKLDDSPGPAGTRMIRASLQLTNVKLISEYELKNTTDPELVIAARGEEAKREIMQGIYGGSFIAPLRELVYWTRRNCPKDEEARLEMILSELRNQLRYF